MTEDQVKSQAVGLALALATAIGCVAYEKLVKNFSFGTVALLGALAYIPFALVSIIVDNRLREDALKLAEHKWSVVIYLASGVTCLCWYLITRKQSVIVGSIYEVKYIVMLTIIYLMFGTDKLTVNTLLGIVLAMCSIYLISK